MRDPNGTSKGSDFVAFSTSMEASRAVSCYYYYFIMFGYFILEVKIFVSNFIAG